MGKGLSKYLTAFDYAYKMFILSGARSGVYLCSFTTVIGTLVGIVSANISIVSLISNGIVKMFPKTM